MEKLFLVVVVFFISCSSLPISSSKGGVETTSFGQGSNKEEALNDAFRNAIEYVSGVIVYDETKVHNSQLLYDKILVYSKGYIKKYNIIFERSNGGLTEVAVKSVVSPELLAHNLVELNVVSKEDIERDLSKLDFAQHKLKNSRELMEKFIGNPSDYFDRAYEMELTGYKVTQMELNGVSGHWLVKITLKTQFWDTWLELLKNSEVARTYTTNYPSQGMFSGCGDTPSPQYNVLPIAVKALPKVILFPIKETIRANVNVRTKFILDKNRVECAYCWAERIDWIDSGCSPQGSYIRSPETPIYYSTFGGSALFLNDIPLFFYKTDYSVVIKVPFQNESIETLKGDLVFGKIPLLYTVEEVEEKNK